MTSAAAAPCEVRDIECPEDALVATLTDVWEHSVRATHTFLTEDDILSIRPFLPEVLRGGDHLSVAFRDGRPVAFAVVNGTKLEALFCDPDVRGTGVGSALLAHAIDAFGAFRLDVNEQNGQAVGFYLHKGFVQVGRSPLDDAGRPFPTLHLELPSASRA